MGGTCLSGEDGRKTMRKPPCRAQTAQNTTLCIISHLPLEAGGACVAAKPTGQFARALQSRARVVLLHQKRVQMFLLNPSYSPLPPHHSHHPSRSSIPDLP